jgi:hypothetical protein
VLAWYSGGGVRANGSPPARHHGTTCRVRAADNDGAVLVERGASSGVRAGDPYFAFFSEQASGPVALFEVDDVHVAHSELIAAGIEVIGSIERDSNWEWLHFRGPDGNLYDLASRRQKAT